jgi:hypothetical protein
MVQQEQKTLSDIVTPLQAKPARRVKYLDNKHFLIRRMQYHLVTQFRVPNGDKHISQVRQKNL